MKTFILSLAFLIISLVAFAGAYKPQFDTVKLKTDGEHAFYQKVVKVDSNLRENVIYLRAIQFMASKNFQQTYGYQEEGKLIFTTTQDLNNNLVYVGDNNDDVDPYTVQFAIAIDIKNGSYRYTIHNIIFYLPTDNGNRRENLYDLYIKVNNKDSKHVAKDAKKLIDSFERYINTLTDDLYEGIEQKSLIYKSKF